MAIRGIEREWVRQAECRCSILNAREEKLLDDEGRVQVRLICNRCGRVLDSEVVSAAPESVPEREESAESAG